LIKNPIDFNQGGEEDVEDFIKSSHEASQISHLSMNSLIEMNDENKALIDCSTSAINFEEFERAKNAIHLLNINSDSSLSAAFEDLATTNQHLFMRLVNIVDLAAINHTQISRRHHDLITHAQTKLIPLVKQDWMGKPNKNEKDALQQYYTDLVNRSLEEEQKQKQLQHQIKLHLSDFAFLTKEASKKASRLKGYVKEDVIKKQRNISMERV